MNSSSKSIRAPPSISMAKKRDNHSSKQKNRKEKSDSKISQCTKLTVILYWVTSRISSKNTILSQKFLSD